MKKITLLLLSLFLVSCSAPKEEEYIPSLKPYEKENIYLLIEDYNSTTIETLTYTNLAFETSLSDYYYINYTATGYFDYSSSFHGVIEFPASSFSTLDNRTNSQYTLSTTYTFNSDDLRNAVFQSTLLFPDGSSVDFYIDPNHLKFLDSSSHEEISFSSEAMEILTSAYRHYFDIAERTYSRFSMIGSGVISIIKDESVFFPVFEFTVGVDNSTFFLKPTPRIPHFYSISINQEEPIPFQQLDPLYQTLSIALYIDSPINSINDVPEDNRLLWLLQMSTPSLTCKRGGEYDENFDFVPSQDCFLPSGDLTSPPDLFSNLYYDYLVYDMTDINQLQDVHFPNADAFNIDETSILPSGVLQDVQSKSFFNDMGYYFHGGLLVEELSENTYAIAPYYLSDYLYNFWQNLNYEHFLYNIDNLFPLNYYGSRETLLEQHEDQLSWIEVKVEPLENSEFYRIVSIKTITK